VRATERACVAAKASAETCNYALGGLLATRKESDQQWSQIGNDKLAAVKHRTAPELLRDSVDGLERHVRAMCAIRFDRYNRSAIL
jgi:hypothetical protein